MRKYRIVVLLSFWLTTCAQANKPNVVLIVCDDLNDYVTGMGGHPQATTPHLARLAETGVAFRRAYSNNPVCAPSRSSFLTGIYPHTSGNLFWNKWFENPVLQNSCTIMEHFRANGYHVAGSGKLMHHHRGNLWSEFKHKADYGPFVYDGKERVTHPDVPLPFGSIGSVDGSYGPLDNVPFAHDGNPLTGWIYGEWGKVKPFIFVDKDNRDLTPDERNAQWAAWRIERFTREKSNKPFFLGIGFIRPHTPLHVPQRYFDMFPVDSLAMPVIKTGDAIDTHYRDVFDQDQKGLRYFRLLNESYPDRETAIKTFTQAYLACVAAVDDCIGQVVDAIDKSPFKDNTIIVVTSDHGWTMGQKDYLFKNSPWEESTRVPFVVRAPGIAKAGGIAEHPISLIDLYPTLVDLCGLLGNTQKNDKGAPLDGYSVRPFLEDPKSRSWDGPDGALTMVYAGGHTKMDTNQQHWVLRTERWRYIRYNNGAEELYDHRKDPREWTNLADSPAYAPIKESLYRKIQTMRKY
jgi:arylsulfatase A-like enzyme